MQNELTELRQQVANLTERNASLEAEARMLLEIGKSCHPRMTLRNFAVLCRRAADNWYHDPKTGMRIQHNAGERYMLMVSEISEAFEAKRKNKMDDHLPHRRGEEVEICDALIRIFDFSGEQDYDLDGAFWEKIAFNAVREDHTAEARTQRNGKQW